MNVHVACARVYHFTIKWRVVGLPVKRELVAIQGQCQIA